MREGMIIQSILIIAYSVTPPHIQSYINGHAYPLYPYCMFHKLFYIIIIFALYTRLSRPLPLLDPAFFLPFFFLWFLAFLPSLLSDCPIIYFKIH